MLRKNSTSSFSNLAMRHQYLVRSVRPSFGKNKNDNIIFNRDFIQNLGQRRIFSSKPSSSSSNNKPTTAVSTATPGKKSSFPFLGLLTILTINLGGLAYYSEIEPIPIVRQLTNQPVINDCIQPFVSAFKALGITSEKSSVAAILAPPKEVEKPKEVQIKESTRHAEPSIEAAKGMAVYDLPKEPEVVVAAAPAAAAENIEINESNNTSEVTIPIEIETKELHPAAVAQVASVEEPNKHKVEPPANTHEHKEASLPLTSTETTLRGISPVQASVASEVLHNAAKSSMALRHELETVMLKDIHNMDADALRIRISQLAAELFERMTWENVRLTHTVKQVEDELTSRYEMLMTRQRSELEAEVNRILYEREKALTESNEGKYESLEKKYQEQLQNAIKAQAEGFQVTLNKELSEQAKRIQTELQDQLNHHIAMLRKSQVDHLLSIQPKIDALHSEFQEYAHILNNSADDVLGTFQSHAISSAILALELVLSAPAPRKQAVSLNFDRVLSLCKNDSLVVNVLATIPPRVKKDGALTLQELQVRFQVMREEARKAALAPENAPKIVGQLIGTALAAVSSTPSGYIAGEGAEEALARAAFHLERGRLQDCVKELKSINGYAKVLTTDWVTLAQERLLVDQAIKVLKAESIVRHRLY